MISSTPTGQIALALFLVLSWATACVPSPEWECRRSSECAQGDFCRAGECRPAIGAPDRGDSDPDAAGLSQADIPPAEPERCDEGEPPQAGDLVLNEVLVNVPGGTDGDANGDGIRDAYDDEFVELVNSAAHTIDLTGVAVANGSKAKFVFGADCLEPQQPAVVFGGGRVAARDGALVRVASSRFAFSNAGGTVALFDEEDRVLATLTYDAAPAEALTLAPQLDGEHYVPHSTLVDERLLSPGRCADGGSFEEGCGE